MSTRLANSLEKRPFRRTIIDDLDACLLHGRSFWRAGVKHQTRHFSESKHDLSRLRHPYHFRDSETHRGTSNLARANVARTLPRINPACENGYRRELRLGSTVLKTIPTQASMDQAARSNHDMFMLREASTLPSDRPGIVTRSNLRPLQKKRVFHKHCCGVLTLMAVSLFAMSLAGYIYAFWRSKSWRTQDDQKEFQIPRWGHGLAAFGLISELTLSIALATRYRYSY